MNKRIDEQFSHWAGLVALLFAGTAVAWTEEPALERAATRLGVDKIDSIEFEAEGTYFQFSQAPGPGLPWPAFDVRGYIATLDFAREAAHSRYTRMQKVEPGRVRPAPTEQRLDQYLANGVTWNVSPDGAPTPIPANLGERTAEIWTMPQGFVKAARTASSEVTSGEEGTTEVAFAIGQFRYEGSIDAAGDVLSVRTWVDSPVLGDTALEWKFLDYRDFDGTRFPARIQRIADGFPWYDLSVIRVRINTAQEIAVPPAVAANPVPLVTAVEVVTLSPGVFYFTGTSHHSVVIEQSEGIVVIEAPLNEERSLSVIARIRELIPNKRITHVVNTHAHFDHAGGLRTYVDEGATVVTARPNVAYYKRAWASPRTLNPDRLAASKRKARFEAVRNKFVLSDSVRSVECYEIVGSGHSDAFLMVYVPAERILVQGDAWTPAPNTPGAAPNPYWVNLYDNIERLRLNVDRIAPLHGNVQTMIDLRAAIGLD